MSYFTFLSFLRTRRHFRGGEGRCSLECSLYVEYLVEVLSRRVRVGGAWLPGVKRCHAMRVQTTCSGTCAVVGHSSSPGAEQWASVGNDCQLGTRSRLTLVKAPWRIDEPEYCKNYRPIIEVRQLLSVAPIMRPVKSNMLLHRQGVFVSSSASFAGQRRAGPFGRFRAELSAERGIAETLLTHVGVVHVVQPLNRGEALSLRIRVNEWRGDHNQSRHTVAHEEGDFVYIAGGALSGDAWEHPDSRTDLGGHLAEPTLTPSQVQTMCDEYERVRLRLQNAWHEQSWRGNTNDSHRNFHKSTEFGWSTMPGRRTRVLQHTHVLLALGR